jgi:hypothetical protein
MVAMETLWRRLQSATGGTQLDGHQSHARAKDALLATMETLVVHLNDLNDYACYSIL